jgi:glyoxylase-like metal-dependent hydrolase (beta-lactamase superfamily II)
MNIEIHPIKLGASRCYVVRGDGVILVDCGCPNQSRRFAQAMAALQLNPRDIKLIVITHGHWDHIGSAKDIKEMTGAPIAMHKRETDWLEHSLKPRPPAVTFWGSVCRMATIMALPLIHFPAAHVDIVLDDDDLSLTDFGIPGKIVYTPGHTMGSVSVLLDTGDALVGDLAMNEFPLCLSPRLPIFAEDLEKAKESWRHLLAVGAKTAYPGHGKAFSTDIMRSQVM